MPGGEAAQAGILPSLGDCRQGRGQLAYSFEDLVHRRVWLQRDGALSFGTAWGPGGSAAK
jgi:hypothetical protein